LECHLLGQTALMQTQRGSDDDNRTTRVVYPLAEQILPEAPLLALEHIAQALQRSLVGTSDGLATASVVEQRIDRLLQHAPLVADDDLRCVQLQQSLEAVVAVDYATIQIVQVRGRETTTIEGDEGA